MTDPTPLFLRALRREPVERPPVWMMRQAGRYLPEFREVRKRIGFLELCKTPDQACEVTLQPIRRYGMDAAIIFSDILIPCEPMGMEVVFDDKGPHLLNPVRTRADVDRLIIPSAVETVPFLGEALRLTRAALPANVPLIGFCGAPWTLAAYMVEGGGSKSYGQIKRLMYGAPEVYQALIDRLVPTLVDYLRFQVASGAQALQIFESWGGFLSPRDFRAFALEPIRQVVAGVRDLGVPVIVYMNGVGRVLEDLAGLGADAVGIDWRTDLGEAFDRVGSRVALQGNLDPCRLYGPPDSIRQEVRRLHAEVAGRPGHIFNLGHGILPDIPTDHAGAFIAAVQELAHVHA
jgi:uroporphyrinogen decarboxylase